MSPTPDSFRALARSSPWRWHTLRFRVSGSWLEGQVEAYVARPGRLWVRDSAGRIHVEQGLPYTQSRLVVGADGPRHEEIRGRLPHQVVPALRPDGLVAERPSSWDVDYDDPMWTNYTWVAMLDPVELSHDVDVEALRADELGGRPVWRADLWARPGYAARCGGGCCELLWSEVSWHCEDSDDDDGGRPVPDGTVFPDHYDVALDVETGVVVRCLPVGGSDAPWLELAVLEVDGPAPSWVAPGAP